jgi:hypothetical protein
MHKTGSDSTYHENQERLKYNMKTIVTKIALEEKERLLTSFKCLEGWSLCNKCDTVALNEMESVLHTIFLFVVKNLVQIHKHV